MVKVKDLKKGVKTTIVVPQNQTLEEATRKTLDEIKKRAEVLNLSKISVKSRMVTGNESYGSEYYEPKETLKRNFMYDLHLVMPKLVAMRIEGKKVGICTLIIKEHAC